MQETYYTSLRETDEQQRRMDLGYSCEVISEASGSGSSDCDGDGDDYSECYIEDLQATATTSGAGAGAEPYPQIDPNDPLRYFLELGEITPNEYDKWKIVKEEPAHDLKAEKQSKRRPDYGPGHNESDSDDIDDGDNHKNNEPTIEYGSGYAVWANELDADPFDPWNPNPDPTPSNDRRYTKLAVDSTFMMKRLTQPVEYEHSASGLGNKCNLKLTDSLELKLLWGRFISSASASASSSSSSSSHQFQQPLQEFWQVNALKTYEALQDLREDHARVRNRKCNRGAWFPKDTPAPPTYHTTPIETLETTFETIGRMSRCMAEDFNTPSVVDYVEEFIMSLYREIEFNALVDAYENKISDAEWDKNANQTYMERKRYQ